MNFRILLGGPVLARVYGALAYLTSLILLFGAAVLTGTHARDAFILVFLPGVLFAALGIFIWSGKRSAMILAFALSVLLELMIVGNDRLDWHLLLAVPVVFGVLTAAVFLAAAPATGAAPPYRTADEVYAALVYLGALLAVFMAPFNHARRFGLPAVALYALLLGLLLGALSVLIRQGRWWAMVAAFALSLLHWLALAVLDPAYWRSIPFLAAPVVAGLLTAVCIATARRCRGA